jgi:hypothetical protein
MGSEKPKGKSRMEKISKFLVQLDSPLHNTRWSWGSRSDLGVLLTTWVDDLDETGRFVRVLGWPTQEKSPNGLNERIDHLRTLWCGGLAGYAIVATAKDPNAQPRKIQSYDGDNIRAIVSLVAEADGSIWAELGDDVPVKKLKQHAVSHRPVPGEGPFPAARKPSKAFTASSAAYIVKLPAMRQWLIGVARRGETVTYAEARAPFDVRSLEHRHAMDRIGHQCVDAGEPILTSLIVDEDTGRCAEGFAKEFRRDEVQEREDCYVFWAPSVGAFIEPGEMREAAPAAAGGAAPDASLQERAACFARVAVRPDQAAFRRRVFLEHKGACVVTGCTIPEALDAAHKRGRNWRLGHNSGTDGLLLRKDIHALYDAGLVSIEENRAVMYRPDVGLHYGGYLRKS